jgi:predicted ATPase/transcriptional regulator with XRE-family HTH domain
MTRPTFAELLLRHRVARGLTRGQLAQRAGVNEDTVRDLERGDKRPRFATVAVLAKALGLTADQLEELRAAAAGVAGTTDAGDAARPSVAPRPRGGLRRGASSFVGREEAVAGVRARLAEHRLVTLTGPGGVGKTRLAVEAAHGLAEAEPEEPDVLFPDGVWLAELAALTDPDLVPRVVAAAVGADLDPDGPPVDALADALRGRRLLLLLDNCEHLVDACAEVAEALLGACPGVRVLATGREPLGCDGEAVFRVPSLTLPPAGGTASPEEIGRAAAARLFVDRAAAAAPGFALTARNAAAVAEVCRRLDGIPLALEFAARLVRALPVEEVAARLDDRFRLLTGGRRTALGRQQTLRALVDWSYDLLAPAERALFVRLSVFAGAFTLESAAAVGGGSGDDAEDGRFPADGPATDVLAPLLRLVDTSFVLTEGGAGQEGESDAVRYRLLETLREYGRERLMGEPEGASLLRDRHLAYHLGLVEAAAAAPAGERQERALLALEAARDDLWAALGWARDRGDPEADRRLAGALDRLADRMAAPAVRQALTPLLFELRRLELPAYGAVERHLLEQTDPDILAAGADLYRVIGDWPAEAAVARRLEEVETAGRAAQQDALAAARGQVRAARLSVVRNGVGEALRLLDAAERTAAERGDDVLRLDVLLERGYAHTHTGDCARGRQAYAEAFALLERLRPRLGESAYRAKRLVALRGSGFVEHNADANGAVLAIHREAVALAREARDGPEEAMALLNLADAQGGCGDYGAALRTYRQALDVSGAAFHTVARGLALLVGGILLWSVGRYAEAARALDDGLAVAHELGNAWWIVYGLTYRSNVHASSGDLAGARRLSREAAAHAEAAGLGYPLYLARAHALWQEEVAAPGRPEHAPRIEEALRETRRLGLRGLEVYLVWVRLLHRIADPAVPDGAIADELAAAARAYRERAPLKGAWELLGLQVLRALGGRRPAVDRAELEALVEEVIRAKAESLAPEERPDYRASRRCWEAAP